MDHNAPNATILRRHDLNPRVAILHVQPDAGAVADFVPGQFVQLGLPADVAPIAVTEPPARTKLVKRSYSIASAPREREAYELFVAFVDDGKLTSKLRSLTVGARLWVDPLPKGFFTLEKVPQELDLVFVATGTGIAPFISMWRQFHDVPGRFRRVVFVHGAREKSDLAYHDELTAAAHSDARLAYVPVLSRELGEWNGLRGHVQVVLEEPYFSEHAGFALVPQTSQVFLCGNPQMIADARELLGPRGFVASTAKVPGNLHFERYW